MTPVPTLADTGKFVATGSMHDGRMSATATFLRDGRVLIAGGSASQSPEEDFYASAELYDPSKGKFTLTGSMTTARTGHTATLLPDGRVLVAGGSGCGKPRACASIASRTLASAELYDPTTGKFTPTGSMATPRWNGSALLLPGGRVLVLNGGSRLVEIYDPATGRFTRKGSLLNYAESATATLLPTGQVLVVGTAEQGITAELFDPDSGRSKLISLPLPVAANGQGNIQIETASAMRGGEVLLQIYDFDSLVNYLVTYQSDSETFAQSGSFSSPAGWLPDSAVSLPDGRVLFAAGTIEYPGGVGGFGISGSAGLYDPATGFHLRDAGMIQARWYETTTLLPDGSVLIAGGIPEDQVALSSAELFEP
jgi:hypothetical protein